MMVEISRMTGQGGRTYCATTPIWSRAEKVILHHTSSPNSSQYRGLSTVQAIQRYHVETRGWRDIGYHFLVGPDGFCYNGRPMNTLGAHAGPGQNQNIGVAAIADWSHENPWEWRALGTLRLCLMALLKRLGAGPEALHFHREFMNTDCPGTLLDLGAFRQYLAQGGGVVDVDPVHPKVVLLPGSEVVDCRAVVEGGVTRCDLRPLAEALGYDVIDHIADQGKVYIRRRAADG